MRFTSRYPPETRDQARILYETTNLSTRKIGQRVGATRSAIEH